MVSLALAILVDVSTNTHPRSVVSPQIFALLSSSPQVLLVQVDRARPEHRVVSHQQTRPQALMEGTHGEE